MIINNNSESGSLYRGFGFPFSSFLFLSLSTEGSATSCDAKSKIVKTKRELIRYSLLKPEGAKHSKQPVLVSLVQTT